LQICYKTPKSNLPPFSLFSGVVCLPFTWPNPNSPFLSGFYAPLHMAKKSIWISALKLPQRHSFSLSVSFLNGFSIAF